jgi:hypothetical protein
MAGISTPAQIRRMVRAIFPLSISQFFINTNLGIVNFVDETTAVRFSLGFSHTTRAHRVIAAIGESSGGEFCGKCNYAR